ncbi:MAG: hypothetical protein KAH21_04680 [Spirochaetaceae bacterium]|nr:hypothetical protein [Spirochaetaceae bacterium]
MIRSGLDEAALGPSLGPFCACLTTFTLPSGSPELYNLLSDSISPKKNLPGRLAVADSKVLYTPSTGIRILETGVTAFLNAAGFSLPCSFTDLLSALTPPSSRPFLKGIPWYEKAGDFSIPWKIDISPTLNTAMETLGISFKLPSLCFIPARDFNLEISAHAGKGGAVRNILSPLLKESINTGRSEERRITVDRQGGRRYYGEWLNEIMPGAPLRALEEGPKRSAYSAGNYHIEFLVGADGIRMETALASMFAKYVRESAMQLFNRWWADKIPGIKPTAGYPQDAKRFIAEIETAGAMPENRDMLIRRL